MVFAVDKDHGGRWVYSYRQTKGCGEQPFGGLELKRSKVAIIPQATILKASAQ
jgi:hypothetical protein